MNIIDAVILGILQGITEFLPVSSSGHLILAERIMGIDSSNLTFSLTVHIATLCALIIAMRHKLYEQIKKPFDKTNIMIVLSTVATVSIVLLIKNFALSSFDGSLLPYTFLITAILLISAGLVKKQKELSYATSIIIGFVQGLAVLPGLSRSGSTISTARLCGVNPKQSTDFSFFISIPIIIGSTIIDCVSGGFSQVDFLPLAVGFVTAFISGLVSIKFMLKFMTKNFDVFSIYLLVLSVFLFANNYFLHII